MQVKGIPCSLSQEQMVLLSMQEGGVAYNQAFCFGLDPQVDPALLSQALIALIDRHEPLRTGFTMDQDGLKQTIAPSAAECGFQLGREAMGSMSPAEVARQAEEGTLEKMDLRSPPLVAAKLFKGNDSAILVLHTHHSIMDGSSLQVAMKDLGAIYSSLQANKPDALREQSIQYSDFAQWQHSQQEAGAWEPHVKFWKEHLAGAPDALDLPADVSDAGKRRGHVGHWLQLQLDADLVDGMRALATRCHASLLAMIVAAFQVVLGRWCRQEDVVVGLPYSGRTRSQLEGLVGNFINMLPIRTGLSAETSFASLLKGVQQSVTDALSHSELPFNKLVEAMGISRSASRTPVFQAVVDLLEAPPSDQQHSVIQGSVEPPARESGPLVTDVVLQLTEHGKELRGMLQCSSDLLSRGAAQRLLSSFKVLLTAAVKDAETELLQLPLLTQHDARTVLEGFNPSKPDDDRVPTICLHHLFEQQADRQPHAACIRTSSETLSYGQVERRANALAHALQSMGVGSDSAVGVMLDRGPDLYVAILAVLKAGAAYLPLDAGYPEDRLQFMASDAAIRVLITTKDLARRTRGIDAQIHLMGREKEPNGNSGRPSCPATRDTLAYIIYTSGTTGKPKGVPVPHCGIVNNLLHTQEVCSFIAEDTFLQRTSVSFDVAVLDTFLPLQAGGCIVPVAADANKDACSLLRQLKECSISVVAGVPSQIQTWVAAGLSATTAPKLRWLMTGAEALPVQMMHALQERLPNISLFFGYGPTEASEHVTCKAFKHLGSNPVELPILVGPPIPQTHIYIVDAQRQLVPVGVPGELLTSGVGLARGYVNRPDLAQEAFIPNTLAKHAQGYFGRMYRTGDLARWTEHGEVQILGRVDRQVKVRGMRVELGEIENVLGGCKGVTGAAVRVTQHPSTKQTCVVGYLSPASQDQASVLTACRKRLPEHMVPVAIVDLDALPTLPNGKVDHKALPDPDWQSLAEGHEYVAPRSEAEKRVAAVWQEVLGLDRIGIHTNFFSAGGTSLLAGLISFKASASFEADASVALLFQHPTIAELAEVLEGDAAESSQIPSASLRPEDKVKGIPCSLSQEQMVLLSMQEGGVAYNQAFCFGLDPQVDPALLSQALMALIDRHEPLRTGFTMDQDGLKQTITPSAADCGFELKVESMDGLSAAEVARRAEETTLDKMDLKRPPLMTAKLCQGDNEAVLVLRTHHSIMDGSSLQVAMRDLEALHQALETKQTPELPEQSIHYSDFAQWQHSQQEAGAWQPHLDFWRTGLAGAPDALDLPADVPSSEKSSSHEGHWLHFQLDVELAHTMRALATSCQASLLALAVAAFQVVLARWCRQEDVVIGLPYSGRTRSQLEGLVGNFINMLPIRTRLSDNHSFESVLRAVQQSITGALSHSELPFNKLVEAIGITRSASRTPVFQAVVDLLENPDASQKKGLVRGPVEPPARTSGPSVTDVVLQLTEQGQELHGMLQCSSDIFSRAAAERLLSSFKELLAAAVKDASIPVFELPMLSQADAAAILHGFNPKPPIDISQMCLHNLFERQADCQPDAPCVRSSQEIMSYGQVENRANALAHVLQSKGVGPGSAVGVMLDRNASLYVAILAVLKAGGAYLPMDSAYPEDRLSFMASDAGIKVLITSKSLMEVVKGIEAQIHLIDEEQKGAGNTTRPTCPATRDSMAYIIYTSGTTGKPKGVPVPHVGIVNNMLDSQKLLGLTPKDIILQRTSISFDVAVFDTFLPLQAGACIVPALAASNQDAHALLKQLKEANITCVDGVPSQVQSWVAAGLSASMAPSLKWLLTGAEALPVSTLETLRERLPEINMYFGYGPTEASEHISCAIFKNLSGRPLQVPILVGKPIPNNDIYILDAHKQLVPVGVPGELFTSGCGLAEGYLNRPDLTAKAFMANTVAADASGYYSRMYGDLARWAPDGQIQILGRVDRQIKVRGMRVELGEIENVLNSRKGVRAAAVRVISHPSTKQACIVGYLTPSDLDKAAAMSLCRQRLPEHMIPIAMVTLEDLPVLPNGKVDHKALPEPDWEGIAEGEGEYVAPRDKSEEKVAAAWRDVLQLERIGVHANFFSAGGTSLLAGMIAFRVGAAFKVDASVALLMRHPTIAELAAKVSGQAAAGQGRQGIPGGAFSPEEKAAGVPLSFYQEQMVSLGMQGFQAYDQLFAYQVEGHLDMAALRRALQAVSERHEMLRTSFNVQDDRPRQVIPSLADIQLRMESRQLRSNAASAVEALRDEQSRQPDDLSRGPLLTLIALKGTKNDVMALRTHHSIIDAWSLQVLLADLRTAYHSAVTGEEPQLPALEVQYSDFAAWQQQQLKSGGWQEHIDFWKSQLAGCNEVLDLPAAQPRPATSSGEGYFVPMSISSALQQKLEGVAKDAKASPLMLITAIFQVVLARYCRQDDVVVGTPTNGRHMPELQQMVGNLVNMLPIRTQISPEATFKQVLAAVRETYLGALEHEDLPFNKLVELLSIQRAPNRTPLFQAIIAVNGQQDVSNGKTPEFSPVLEEKEADFGPTTTDVVLELTETGNGMQGRLICSTDVFSRAGGERFASSIQMLLEAAVNDIEAEVMRLPLMGLAAVETMFWATNPHPPSGNPAATCLHQLFEAAAHSHPNAACIQAESGTLSYAEVDAKANQVARQLISLGLKPGQVAGVMADRSPELYIAMISVLKTGAAYVPCDPTYPADRLHYMVQDSGLKILLTQEHLKNLVVLDDVQVCVVDSSAWTKQVQQQPSSSPNIKPDPDSMAFMIFTSGTTGRPKGVIVPHRGLVNNILHSKDILKWGTEDIIWQRTSISFDMQKLKITAFAAVPTLLQTWLAAGLSAKAVPSLTWLLTGAEAMSVELLQRLREAFRRTPIYFGYGPTEASEKVSLQIFNPRQPVEPTVLVGKAMPNVEIYILDSQLQPVPMGVAGELCCSGVNLAKGYHGRPDLTAEAFVDNPFVKEGNRWLQKMYRTGDLARLAEDGRIQILGRIDRQVKLRGLRIELGEIERVISNSPGVNAAAVAVHKHPATKQDVLVGYATPAGILVKDCLQACRQHLPKFMVPVVITPLESFPLLPNGKLDTNSLPVPDWSSEGQADEHVAPETPAEQTLQGIWSEVLDKENISVMADFFELGGTSLVAGVLLGKINRRLETSESIAVVFRCPTIRSLAKHMEAARRGDGQQTIPQLDAEDKAPGMVLPGTPKQELWHGLYTRYGELLAHLEVGLQLRGVVPRAAIQAALDALMQRHEALRTRLLWQDPSTGLHQTLVDYQPGLLKLQVFSGEESDGSSSADSSSLKGRAAHTRQITVPHQSPSACGHSELSNGNALPTANGCVDGEVGPAENGNASPGPLGHQPPWVLDCMADLLLTHFDFREAPLARAALFEVGPEESLLVLVVHHVISDAWALQLLSSDLNAALETALELHESTADSPAVLDSAAKDDSPNSASSTVAGRLTERLGQPPLQQMDYSAWLCNQLESKAGVESRRWWDKQLRGCRKLELPAEPDCMDASDPAAASTLCHMSDQGLQNLKSAAACLRTSNFIVMMAAFQITLGAISQEEKFMVLTPLGNRARPELQGLVSDTANEVMVPANLCGQSTYRQVIHNVRRFVMDSQTHGWMPIQELAKMMPEGYDLHSRQVFFGMPDVPNKADVPQSLPGHIKADQLSQEVFQHVHKSRQVSKGAASVLHDLAVDFVENAGRLQAHLKYAKRLFAGSFPEQLMHMMEDHLQKMSHDPSQAFKSIAHNHG
ncbi:hypothetical protein WJX74_001268 [Apatococcus lobatus]|uniref:Carrier domain-containing protein n=1 Tax=Apatococcus lobatus TaxID=904363 RepID=A0AAW1S182_9CHLO